MCGIVGGVTNRDITPLLLDGLKRLEYRGYDSSGLVVLSKKNSYLMNFLILYFITNIAILSVFFILPRYTLAILPLQFIFSNVFFEYIKNNFFKT